MFHHISGIAVVLPTKFSKIAGSIAAHYLKWVGQLQELRINDTSLIPDLGQKGGSGPQLSGDWMIPLLLPNFAHFTSGLQTKERFYIGL